MYIQNGENLKKLEERKKNYIIEHEKYKDGAEKEATKAFINGAVSIGGLIFACVYAFQFDLINDIFDWANNNISHKPTLSLVIRILIFITILIVSGANFTNLIDHVTEYQVDKDLSELSKKNIEDLDLKIKKLKKGTNN